MKEATGELNMTVVTVVAISAIAGFFTLFIWPGIKNNITMNTYCATASCNEDGTKCTYYDDQGDKHENFDCSKYFENHGVNIKQ